MKRRELTAHRWEQYPQSNKDEAQKWDILTLALRALSGQRHGINKIRKHNIFSLCAFDLKSKTHLENTIRPINYRNMKMTLHFFRVTEKRGGGGWNTSFASFTVIHFLHKLAFCLTAFRDELKFHHQKCDLFSCWCSAELPIPQTAALTPQHFDSEKSPWAADEHPLVFSVMVTINIKCGLCCPFQHIGVMWTE